MNILISDYINSLLNTLIIKNFTQIFLALDETLILLLVSLPIGFVLSLIFALGRVSNNIFLSKTIASYIFIIRGTPVSYTHLRAHET